MNQMLKYVIAMLPAVGMAILCGCTIGDPIEPMYEGREIELPVEPRKDYMNPLKDTYQHWKSLLELSLTFNH